MTEDMTETDIQGTQGVPLQRYEVIIEGVDGTEERVTVHVASRWADHDPNNGHPPAEETDLRNRAEVADAVRLAFADPSLTGGSGAILSIWRVYGENDEYQAEMSPWIGSSS